VIDLIRTTTKKREIADISDEVTKLVTEKDTGVVNLFVTHTTADLEHICTSLSRFFIAPQET
jgi:thiamine phosphate synthase YjbQ (UPF0047 family)